MNQILQKISQDSPALFSHLIQHFKHEFFSFNIILLFLDAYVLSIMNFRIILLIQKCLY